MIEASGVHKSFTDGSGMQRVLDGLELEVAKGEFVAILGESGSGKSTLLHLIGGLDSDFEGRIVVDGRSLRGLGDASLSRFRAETIGFVFQDFHLVPELSALENVALPGWFETAGGDAASLRARAVEILDMVGLEGKEHRRPDHLSGGERQRVAIARALFSKPKILLCDEPTGNLDAKTGREIIALFQRLGSGGITLLMVTHEARVAEAASRVLRLSRGKLHASGSAEGEASKVLLTDEASR